MFVFVFVCVSRFEEAAFPSCDRCVYMSGVSKGIHGAMNK